VRCVKRCVGTKMGVTVRLCRLFFLLALAVVGSSAREAPAAQPTEQQPSAQPSRASQAQPPSQLIVNGRVLGYEVPSRPDEFCIVCRRSIGKAGVVYLVNGQRVPIHVSDCYARFRRNPLAYLASLQPHGAFLGAGSETQNLPWGWFVAGLYVLAGVVFGALCAHRALGAGRNPAAWFGAGLALNIVGYVWLLARPKLAIESPGGVPEGLGKTPASLGPQPCPRCGRMNHPAATQCADCGAQLQPTVSSEVGRAGLRAG
jgi:hypothetical protein